MQEFNDLKLRNGHTAKFLFVDFWSRPVYEIKTDTMQNPVQVCCPELSGTYLHTMTADYGEPIAPLKMEFQPIVEGKK